MGRTIGDDFMCNGKKGYPTYWKARKSAKQLNRVHNDAKGNIYHCPICHKWHVGNSMGRIVKKYENRSKVRRILNGRG